MNMTGAVAARLKLRHECAPGAAGKVLYFDEHHESIKGLQGLAEGRNR
jgi:hypothetical protein